MTPRQRVLTALEHKPPDRVPLDYWAFDGFSQRLQEFLGLGEREELLVSLGIDLRRVGPGSIAQEERLADGSLLDAWGVRYREVPYSGGSHGVAVQRPLEAASSAAQVEAYPMPRPSQIMDFSPISEGCRLHRDLAILYSETSLFVKASELMGVDKLLLSFYDAPSMLQALLERLVEFHLEAMDLAASAGQLDVFGIYDPYAMNTGPIIGLEMFRRFALGPLRTLCARARRLRMKVLLQCRGSCLSLIPGFIEAGVDALAPVEVQARGMEPGLLKREFGRDLCFWGGVDALGPLLHGPQEEVAREVEAKLAAFGPTGYILAPTHDIEVATPPENVLAMYRAAAEAGRGEAACGE